MIMRKQTPMTIGVLAKQANIGVETVRFYERKGIIQQPPKVGGFVYSDDDIKRIRLVKKIQEIGFTLEEIKGFLAFDSCSQDTKQAISKSSVKIQEVSRMRLTQVLRARLSTGL